jgi:cytochrome c
MLSKTLLIVLGGGAILHAATPEDRGKDVFIHRCSGCHAPDINKEGPKLRGVYGGHAANVRGFAYSESLKKAGIKWDDSTLDRWLADPEAIAPDTDMAFRLGDSAERNAVIAYLKSLRNQ